MQLYTRIYIYKKTIHIVYFSFYYNLMHLLKEKNFLTSILLLKIIKKHER